MSAQFTHDPGCEYARDPAHAGLPYGHEDAARRVADTYMLHRLAGGRLGSVGKVFAVALHDGSSDGVEWIRATPHTKDSVFERIRIGFRGGLPVAMQLRDSF